MALSEADKVDIRMYTGWSEVYHQTDQRLELAILAIPPGSAFETAVLADLVALRRYDTAIEDAEQRIMARSYDGVVLPGPFEIGQLQGLGRMRASRLCRRLGVEKRGDAFSAGSVTHRQDTYGVTPAPGGGNYVPQG